MSHATQIKPAETTRKDYASITYGTDLAEYESVSQSGCIDFDGILKKHSMES
jgi:hypothetical protein